MDFSNILKHVEGLLKEAGEFDENIQHTFQKLGKLELHQHKVQVRNQDHAIKDVCKDVISSDYLFEKCCKAALSKALKEIETLEKFEVPESLLPKVVEIKGYFVKIKEKLEKADLTIEKILSQIDEFEQRDYFATDVELTKVKMMNIDLGHHIKAANRLQNAVQDAMGSLESDLKSYRNQDIGVGVASTVANTAMGFAGGYGVGLVLNAAVGAAAAGVGFLSNAAQILSKITTVRKVAAAGAVLAGAKEFKGQLGTLFGKYRERLGKCNEIKALVNHLRNDVEERRQTHEETLPEKISLLKLVRD